MTGRFEVGDRITLCSTTADPIEITLHRHAVVTEVCPADSGGDVTYLVGHPWMSSRRYGPYPEERLIRGWDAP